MFWEDRKQKDESWLYSLSSPCQGLCNCFWWSEHVSYTMLLSVRAEPDSTSSSSLGGRLERSIEVEEKGFYRFVSLQTALLRKIVGRYQTRQRCKQQKEGFCICVSRNQLKSCLRHRKLEEKKTMRKKNQRPCLKWQVKSTGRPPGAHRGHAPVTTVLLTLFAHLPTPQCFFKSVLHQPHTFVPPFLLTTPHCYH